MGVLNRTLKEKACQQLKEFLLIALYLWLVFGLLIVYRSVVLAEYHLDFAYHGLALINALALAKVMLVAKDLHLGERFDEAPLIYPTLLKSALFTVVLACFKLMEEAVGALLSPGILPPEYRPSRRRYVEGNTYSHSASVPGAYPFRWIRRTAKSAWG